MALHHEPELGGERVIDVHSDERRPAALPVYAL
jgi:hypothetical protein